MSESLARKYRPQSFDAMVGQRLTAVVLQQMVTTGSVPSGLLFSGPRGTGKTSAARILAMELNPSDRESILSGTSLAVIEIDAASNGSVADIRALVEQLRFEVGAENRVVILDEAHSITRDGFNALLKTLEEPPAGVTFVLVTTEPQKLPGTILSRVMEFEFRRVSPVEMFDRLVEVSRAENVSLPQELLASISEDADGSVRDAVKNLDFAVRAGIDTVEKYADLIGRKDTGPLLLAAVLSGDHAVIFKALDRAMLDTGDSRVISDSLNDVITDLFVLKAGGDVTASGKALEQRVRLAKAVDVDSLYAAVQILWDLRTKVRWSEDQRSSLSLALVLVADRLAARREATAIIPDMEPESAVASDQDAPRALSVSELMQI